MPVKNLERLQVKLDNMKNIEVYKSAMNTACIAVERSAKQKCPRKTGDLKRSVTHEVSSKGSGIEGVIGSSLEYAPYVELGTGLYAVNGDGRTNVPWAFEDEATGELIWTAGQHPQPFLQPAFDEHKKEIKDFFKRIVEQTAKKEAL